MSRARNRVLDRASGRAAIRALRGLALCAAFAVGAGHAQTDPADNTVSRQAIEQSAQDHCEGVSVVVQRCVTPPEEKSGRKADDPLTRSRVRAKAAFDLHDRRARQEALDAGDGAAGADPGAPAHGKAEQLAPVIVTGRAVEPHATIEEILQRALAPPVVSPNGTVTTYGVDGARTECIARCVGPMCCVTLRPRPDPARDSNSIGR